MIAIYNVYENHASFTQDVSNIGSLFKMQKDDAEEFVKFIKGFKSRRKFAEFIIGVLPFPSYANYEYAMLGTRACPTSSWGKLSGTVKKDVLSSIQKFAEPIVFSRPGRYVSFVKRRYNEHVLRAVIVQFLGREYTNEWFGDEVCKIDDTFTRVESKPNRGRGYSSRQIHNIKRFERWFGIDPISAQAAYAKFSPSFRDEITKHVSPETEWQLRLCFSGTSGEL
jgi:hypothetical protein